MAPLGLFVMGELRGTKAVPGPDAIGGGDAEGLAVRVGVGPGVLLHVSRTICHKAPRHPRRTGPALVSGQVARKWLPIL